MGLYARKPEGSGDFEPIEAGLHQSVCYRVYDLGSQFNERFGKTSHRVMITWEVPDSRIEVEGEDLPRVISKEYTLSLHQKADLYKDLVSWRGREFTEQELAGFDLSKVLSANAMLNITHKHKEDKTYSQISGVSPLMKGMAKKDPENKALIWSFVDDGPDKIPEDMPEWILSKIKQSNEWQEYYNSSHGNSPNHDSGSDEVPQYEDDDIPF